MAARLEFFALDGDDPIAENVLHDLGTTVPVDLSMLGFVSADDEDEATLYGLLGELAETGDFDPRTQSTGYLSAAEVAGLLGRFSRVHVEDVVTEAGEDLEMIVGWRDAIRTSLTATTVGVAWRMRYDRGGSVDDGDDEFVTGWSVEDPSGA